jgi:hypothetical protein
VGAGDKGARKRAAKPRNRFARAAKPRRNARGVDRRHRPARHGPGPNPTETDMTTKRIALAAALLATGLAAGAAHAQAPFAGGGNVAGGGLAGTLTGGGDDAQVTYAQPGAGGGEMHLFQAGRLGRFAGSLGDGPRFEYGPPAAADAGREAWVTGGGADAQVTYGRPR